MSYKFRNFKIIKKKKAEVMVSWKNKRPKTVKQDSQTSYMYDDFISIDDDFSNENCVVTTKIFLN